MIGLSSSFDGSLKFDQQQEKPSVMDEPIKLEIFTDYV
jgi:hypothetical protein